MFHEVIQCVDFLWMQFHIFTIGWRALPGWHLALLRLGWIISSIIPRMQSETPKPRQQLRASRVIMAIGGTSSHWICPPPAATKRDLFPPPSRCVDRRAGSHAARSRAGFVAHTGERTQRVTVMAASELYTKVKTSVYFFCCVCECVYRWLLACRLIKCPTRCFYLASCYEHVECFYQLGFSYEEVKMFFLIASVVGLKKWMTAQVKAHKTCSFDRVCV